MAENDIQMLVLLNTVTKHPVKPEIRRVSEEQLFNIDSVSWQKINQYHLEFLGTNRVVISKYRPSV